MNTQRLIERIEGQHDVTDPHARWLVDFGRERKWETYVVGRHEPLAQDVLVNGWRVGPLTQNDLERLPAFARERLDAFSEASPVRLRWAMFHEPREQSSQWRLTLAKNQPWLRLARNIAVALLPIVAVAAVILAGILLMVALIAALLPVILAFVMLLALASFDPILVAITPDNTWVAVAAWDDEEDSDATATR